jgi:hypothetical protein
MIFALEPFLTMGGRKSSNEFAIVTALRGKAETTSKMGNKMMRNTRADVVAEASPRPLNGYLSHMRVTGDDTDGPK